MFKTQNATNSVCLKYATHYLMTTYQLVTRLPMRSEYQYARRTVKEWEGSGRSPFKEQYRDIRPVVPCTA